MHRRWIGPAAALLLAVGIGLAIAGDGHLPAAGARALFGVLMLLELVMVEWLLD